MNFDDKVQMLARQAEEAAINQQQWQNENLLCYGFGVDLASSSLLAWLLRYLLKDPDERLLNVIALFQMIPLLVGLTFCFLIWLGSRRN